MTLSLKKCQFACPKIKYLGLLIDRNGTRPNPERVEAILKLPHPSFLGTINFYRSYIPNIAILQAPLNELNKENVKFVWTERQQNAFEQLLNAFAQVTLHKHPDFARPFHVFTDVSTFGIGGAIYQYDNDGNPHSISFAACTLHTHEKNYTINELELLAIIHTLVKNFHLLCGRRVHLYTDNHANTFLKRSDIMISRMNRWLMFLENFDFTIEHISGVKNTIADTLSRFQSTGTKNPALDLIPTTDHRVELFDYEIDPKLVKVLKELKAHQASDKSLAIL